MHKIVFHKRRDTFDAAPGFKLEGSLLPNEVIDVLVAFEGTPNGVLNALTGHVTGWRTKLYADEVEFEFVGDGWSVADMAQGKNRATPVFLRGD